MTQNEIIIGNSVEEEKGNEKCDPQKKKCGHKIKSVIHKKRSAIEKWETEPSEPQAEVRSALESAQPHFDSQSSPYCWNKRSKNEQTTNFVFSPCATTKGIMLLQNLMCGHNAWRATEKSHSLSANGNSNPAKCEQQISSCSRKVLWRALLAEILGVL